MNGVSKNIQLGSNEYRFRSPDLSHCNFHVFGSIKIKLIKNLFGDFVEKFIICTL